MSLGLPNQGIGSSRSIPTSALSTPQRAQLPQVKMAELDYSNAAALQPIGFRFLIPVPDLGNENENLQIKNWKGEMVSVRGFAFVNETDQALQAVDGDGTGVLIALIDIEKHDRRKISRQIIDKVGSSGGWQSLDKTKLNSLLEFIKKLGINDIYNSNDSIAQSMTLQEELGSSSTRPFGLYEKKDKTGPCGVFVAGPAAVLDGPHAGTATYDSGFLAVRIPPKTEGGQFTYRSVAPEAIASCYKLADGTPISDPKLQLPVKEV